VLQDGAGGLDAPVLIGVDAIEELLEAVLQSEGTTDAGFGLVLSITLAQTTVRTGVSQKRQGTTREFRLGRHHRDPCRAPRTASRPASAAAQVRLPMAHWLPVSTTVSRSAPPGRVS
jgi:hypothetical protein